MRASSSRARWIAEKFQAMVYLRTLNSRMEDFYDVRLLARQFAFDNTVLANTIAATFKNRKTTIDVAPIEADSSAPTNGSLLGRR